MKLISLNTWCGIIYEPLKKFIEDQAKDTDIFCFQEIRNGKYLGALEGETEDLFTKIKDILPDFKGYYTEMLPGIGIATFVKNSIEIEKFKSDTVLFSEELSNIEKFNNEKPHPRVIQIILLKNKLNILNFHGVHGDFKKDTKERELQTKRLKKILNDLSGPKILVGDFNLMPDTMAIFELEKEMRNLMKGSHFKTTRSSYYEKRDILPFADYAFVSKDIVINNFEVLPNEVSDHLALLLEFNWIG